MHAEYHRPMPGDVCLCVCLLVGGARCIADDISVRAGLLALSGFLVQCNVRLAHLGNRQALSQYALLEKHLVHTRTHTQIHTHKLIAS